MEAPGELAVLTVSVGRMAIALAAHDIHTVHGWRHHAPPTPLPDSPPWLLGLIDTSAGLASVIHLDRLAGVPPRQDDHTRPRLIICRHRPPLALRVEATCGVCRITPGTGAASVPPVGLAPFLEGGWQLTGRPIWRLDLNRLARHVARRN